MLENFEFCFGRTISSVPCNVRPSKSVQAYGTDSSSSNVTKANVPLTVTSSNGPAWRKVHKFRREETKYDDLDLFVGSLLGSGFKSWPSAYELEKCPNGTTVVFIFDNCQNGVFVLSNDLSIHKICSTFEQYIRLAIVHLGLRDWQLWYTTDIPSLNSQQLCSLYIPERLLLNAPEYREQILFYLEDQCPISFDPKKLIDLEITRRDRSKFSSKIAAPGVQSKRGRSSDSLNLRTTETLSTGRKLKNK
ncbi:unnamed protein product [Heterobilharzia americana]|nr:unnamed protein product [Heterobilharzia americana]